MTEDKRNHWDSVYASKKPLEVSWYQHHLNISLEFISRAGVPKNASIVDVGGGASTLVDDLLANGYENITVLDISGEAIQEAKARLGKSADKITWQEADITKADLLEDSIELWHDRAAFHFLTDPSSRRHYVNLANKALKPGGNLVMATFSLDGPLRCSGLEVVRYSPKSLHSELGQCFQLIETLHETHETPFGSTQEFIYCRFFKKGK